VANNNKNQQQQQQKTKSTPWTGIVACYGHTRFLNHTPYAFFLHLAAFFSPLSEGLGAFG